MNIFHLVYKSFASSILNQEPKEESIQKILTAARNFNKSHELTGLLIYRQNAFIQLLEGPEAEVTSLYNKIKADKRHERVQTMIQTSSEQRIFDDWSMAFVNENTTKGATNDLFDLFDAVIQNNNTDKNVILPILKRFLRFLPDGKPKGNAIK